MPVKIDELRLSLIRVQALPNLVAADAPLAFLGDSLGYEQAFSNSGSTGQFGLPWPKLLGQHFWEHYLGNIGLKDFTGAKAWKFLVPFFGPSLAKISMTVASVKRISAEGYLYPHAVAGVITVVLQDNLPLAKIVDTAVNLVNTERYDILWPDKTTSDQLSLEGLSVHLLDHLSHLVLGTSAQNTGHLAPLFSVATVVKGSGVKAAAKIKVNGEVHKALAALCNWHTTWHSDNLAALDPSVTLAYKDAETMPAGHILYGLERSRTIWFPGYFTSKLPIHKLGCYHRNLTLATLQTESLAALMKTAAGFLDRHENMSAALDSLTKYAAGNLGRLYGAVDDTYRSQSVRRQIDDNHLVETINQVRDYYGLGHLK